ncbi:MAG: 4Fe-4S dicluster domain-containing protein [Planctomycetota bacterium]
MSADEKLDRREFVTFSLTAGAGGAVIGSAVFARPPAEEVTLHEGYDPRDFTWGFVVDTTRCIGCGSCVRACAKENDVPEGYYRTWVERYEIAKDETINVQSPRGAIAGFLRDGFGPDEAVMKAFFVPKLCNHCLASACTQVCPVGATFHSPDGVILVDRTHCMGCGYCVQACPYGCRFLNQELGVADKCTLCYHRITRGLPTACVQACPVGARLCGNLDDEDSEIRKKLRERRYGLLKPDLGTRPKCFYIGLDLEVV